MKASRRARLFEISFTQSLLFVGFAAILITLYRLLFIHTVVSFPHFIFWEYWCAQTPVGTNLETLFRIAFLLAAILILLVVVLAIWHRKKGFLICGSVDLLTVFLLLCYAIQPAIFFEGPYCRQVAGYEGAKSIEGLVGASFARPEGKRPVYCGWDLTCWVDDEFGVIHASRIDGKSVDAWTVLARLFEPRTVPENTVLASMEDTLVEQQTNLCLKDAVDQLKPYDVYFRSSRDNDHSAWKRSFPNSEEELVNTFIEVEEFFTLVDNKPPRLAKTESGDFFPYVHPQTSAVWVPFYRKRPPGPWAWYDSPFDVSFIGRVSLLHNFVVCVFEDDKYVQFAVRD